MTPDQILMAAWVAKTAVDLKATETNFRWDAGQEIFNSLNLVGMHFSARESDNGNLIIVPGKGSMFYYDSSGAIRASVKEVLTILL